MLKSLGNFRTSTKTPNELLFLRANASNPSAATRSALAAALNAPNHWLGRR